MVLKLTLRSILYIISSTIVVSISAMFLYNQSTILSDSDKCKLHISDESREILESDIQLESLWSISGIPIENFESKDLMVSMSGSVIVASTGCDTVISFDGASGELNWKHLPINPEDKFKYGDLHQPRNITLDISRQAIYVSATNEIKAISVDDGSMIWSNVSDNFERNAHSVVIDEEGQLTVSAKGSWYINPDTGELSDYPINSVPDDIQHTIDSIAMTIVDEIDDYYPISNIVSTNELVFVLDELARLHVIDKDSSVETHTIRFAMPEKTELLYEPGAIGGSWIAFDNNVIVIYFQDTDVLSAYQIVDTDF